jgi:RNA polymerase sigma factor (TIGR02999 family)
MNLPLMNTKTQPSPFSSTPAGCTGIAQPFSVSFGRSSHSLAANRPRPTVEENNRFKTSLLIVSTYNALCRIAARTLKGEQFGYALNNKELVHEAFLRIVDSGFPSNCTSPGQFCRVTERIMQNILVDEARKRKTKKRGTNVQVLSLDEFWFPAPGKNPEELLSLREDLALLHEVLDRLGRIDPQKRQIVELLFFEECTVAQTAARLGLSVSTVKTHCNLAKMWIRGHLEYRRNRRVVKGLDLNRPARISTSEIKRVPKTCDGSVLGR